MQTSLAPQVEGGPAHYGDPPGWAARDGRAPPEGWSARSMKTDVATLAYGILLRAGGDGRQTFVTNPHLPGHQGWDDDRRIQARQCGTAAEEWRGLRGMCMTRRPRAMCSALGYVFRGEGGQQGTLEGQRQHSRGETLGGVKRDKGRAQLTLPGLRRRSTGRHRRQPCGRLLLKKRGGEGCSTILSDAHHGGVYSDHAAGMLPVASHR